MYVGLVDGKLGAVTRQGLSNPTSQVVSSEVGNFHNNISNSVKTSKLLVRRIPYITNANYAENSTNLSSSFQSELSPRPSTAA